MRIMRGRVIEALWDGRQIEHRGWWVGFRHRCWRGRYVIESIMRALFINEQSVAQPVIRSRRKAFVTEPCRHCRMSFALPADNPEGLAMQTEVDTLRRLGFRSAQQVGSSPDSWPQGIVSSKPVRFHVR